MILHPFCDIADCMKFTWDVDTLPHVGKCYDVSHHCLVEVVREVGHSVHGGGAYVFLFISHVAWVGHVDGE